MAARSRLIAVWFLVLCGSLPVSLSAQAPAEPAPAAVPLYKDLPAIRAMVAPLEESLRARGLVPKSPVVEIATLEELQQVLRTELGPQLASVLAGATADQLQQMLDQTVDVMGPSLLCKYSFSTKTVFVIPENFERVDQLLPEGKVLEPEFFEAVMLHELVHACDDGEVDLGKRANSATSAEGLQALNALIEGHAQWVSKGVLEAQGKLEWFQRMETSISSAPPGMDPSLAYLASIVMANANIYGDGLRFFEAMSQRSPVPTFAQLMEKPPASLDVILVPARYGGEPPKTTLAIDSGLAAFATAAQRDGWVGQDVPMSLATIRATFGLLPAAKVAAALPGIVHARAHARVPAMAPQSANITAGVFESVDEAGAATLYEMCLELHRTKDEQMKTGMLRIVSSEYQEGVMPGAGRSIQARKVVSAGGTEILVHSLLLLQGKAMIEVLSAGIDAKPEELRTWATALVAALEGKPAPGK